MNRKTSIIPLVITSALLLSGCATHEVILYMQNLEVQAPIAQPPVIITKDPKAGEVHVIPRVSIATRQSLDGRINGHTPVNAQGVFLVDTVRSSDNSVYFQDRAGINTYQYNGRNLRWKLPSTTASLDVDIGVSKGVALAFGASYSSTTENSLLTCRAGMGLRGINKAGILGYRLDFGWMWQEHAYEALTVVTDRPLSSSNSTVAFYLDSKSQTTGNFYGSFTINSIKPEWPINFLFQTGIAKQSISRIEPGALRPEPWIVPPYFLVNPYPSLVVDKRGEFSPAIIHIMPGAYIGIAEKVSIILGLRFSFITAIDDLSQNMVVSTLIQLDWEL